jgi:hypothetical protein
MVMRHCWSLAGLLLLALPALGGAAEPSEAKERYRIRVPHRAGTAVRRAVLSVQRRLADGECRRVLSDFSSRTQGQPLRDVLESRGVTAEEHLAALVFKDGSGKPTCASPEILAFTQVDGDTVYVCAPQFTRAVENDPAFADVVLIHELLHTMGLGENPPTSREITARVEERCGDWRRSASRTWP